MITILGLVLGTLFIAVPLCVAYFYRLAMCRRLLLAFVKLLLRMTVVGGLVYLLLQTGSIVLDVFCALAIIAYFAFSVVVKARLSVSLFLLPVSAGMLSAVLLCGSLLLFANISIGGDFFVRYVLPVVALLLGGIVVPMARALSTYYAGLRHHNNLYYFLIGNGASHDGALLYLQKRAIESSFLPGMKTMSAMAVGVSPVITWTLVMCGKSAFEAAGWQVLVVLAVFCSSVVAVVVALAIARHYVIDGYANIRVGETEIKSNEVDETETSNNENEQI